MKNPTTPKPRKPPRPSPITGIATKTILHCQLDGTITAQGYPTLDAYINHPNMIRSRAKRARAMHADSPLPMVLCDAKIYNDGVVSQWGSQ